MLRLNAILLIALFIACVFAAPYPTKKSFVVPRIRNSKFVRNGPKALAKAHRKYGITKRIGGSGIPSLEFRSKKDGQATTAAATTTAATNSTGEGEVTATAVEDDAEFVATVKVGGQSMVMDFDTGSSDMWVFNTNLAAADTKGHTVYDPTKSTTSASTNERFDISYGDGSFANGPVGTDEVNIGGAVVKTQVIGLPNNVSTSFVQDTSSNGLVGLAFSKLNTVTPTQAQTFFDNVKSSLATPVLTANLKANTTGAYTFGEVDSSAFQGSLSSVAVDTTNGFWQFDSKTFAVGGGATQQNTNSGTAIADTGTSLLLVDDSVLEGYYSQVEGAEDTEEGVVYPCSSTLPSITVATGNSTATIGSDLLTFEDAGDGTCFGAVQSNEGSDFQIYGDTFFQANFVAFYNTETPTLGVAAHAT